MHDGNSLRDFSAEKNLRFLFVQDVFYQQYISGLVGGSPRFPAGNLKLPAPPQISALVSNTPSSGTPFIADP